MGTQQRKQDSLAFKAKVALPAIREEGPTAPYGETESTVKDSEQSFRLLFDCAPDAMFVANIETGIIEDANQAATRLLLRSKEEIIGMHFSMLHPPEMLEKTKEHFHTHILQSEVNGDLYPIEHFALRSDGKAVPIEVMAASLTFDNSKKLLGIFRDISRRRQMEDELRESAMQLTKLNMALEKELDEREKIGLELRNRKARFETLFNCMAQGAFYWNQNGGLSDVNPSALELLGLSREQFLKSDASSPLWKVINEDGSELPLEERPSSFVLRGRPVREKIIGVFNPKTGAYVWLVVNAMPQFREGASQPAEVFVTLHDITDTKQMESELRKSQENLENRVEERTLELQNTYGQLLHAEKLSAIGSLSASIAHEFNNPLQSVMTVIKGILSHSPLGEKEKALIDMALKECGRMRDLIRSMQDFNRPSSGRWAPMNLNTTIDCILLLGKFQYARKGITVVRDYAADLPQINAVADQVKQVLLNLLNNATDACEDGGGTITISTAIDDGGYVKIAVRDSGKGIPPEIMPRIFEPFFTTKPESKGTGLGLSVSHDIVKRHGGRIEVASESGRGTVFTVVLPVNRHPANNGISSQ